MTRTLPLSLHGWITGLLLVLFLFPSLVCAGDASPSLDPIPRVNPLVPSVDDPATLTPADRLQRHLESLIRNRDQRIRDLLLERQDLRPAHGDPRSPALAEPLHERDQARLDLRRALEAYDERVIGRFQDVLDTSRPAGQAIQRSTLAATNQLRIAECYHDLAATATPSANDLRAGRAALGLIEIAELGEGEPVRYRYLITWFLIEQTRQSHGDARTKLLAEANAAVERLALDFKSSELATAARGLLAGLTLPGTVNQ